MKIDLKLTLWLQFVDKSAQQICLLGMDGQQIDLLDSTIVP